MRSAAALAVLAGASWTIGGALLARVRWVGIERYERVALRLTAGLGGTALLLSIAALAGFFAAMPVLLAALALWALVRLRAVVFHAASPPRRIPNVGGWAIAVLAAAALGSLGAFAPVTDDDALAYVVPIARHIADSGTLAVWPDQARSMWPTFQHVLLAFMLRLGGDRLGLLTAFELWLVLGVTSALARRTCARSEHVALAVILAIGSPVVAFQIASAKEDLLLVAAASAAVFSLAGATATAELAAAGLFAGVAAGVKYPGALVAAGVAASALVLMRRRRIRSALVVLSAAVVMGGLPYALNAIRYGNPAAPLMFGAPGTPYGADVARRLSDSYGHGRSLASFVAAPMWMFLDAAAYCGRANLFNPLVYVGLAGLAGASSRRRHQAAFIVAGVVYVGWFFSIQNARLLLPSAALLAPAAADGLGPLARRRIARAGAAVVVIASLAIVAAVGLVRLEREARDPSTFLERETQNYRDVAWMNAHLDPAHDRVASDHKALGYLLVPWIVLDPSYQLEISADDLGDPSRLAAALRRAGITHVFGNVENLHPLTRYLRRVYDDPRSRRGGVRFFREPPTEATAVYELIPAPEPAAAPAPPIS